MEVLDDCGVADAIYAVGTPPEQLRRTSFYAGFAGHPDAGRVLFTQETWGAGGEDPDWVAASPKLTTNLPQIRLEPLMKARAEELAPGRIRFFHEVTALEEVDGGVIATVTDLADKRTYEIEARYVLGCDGGRTVGRLAGIELEGLLEVGRTATVHLAADLSEWAKETDVLLRWVFCPANAKLVVLAPMGPTRWGGESEEWVVHVTYDLEDQRPFDDAAVLEDVRERARDRRPPARRQAHHPLDDQRRPCRSLPFRSHLRRGRRRPSPPADGWPRTGERHPRRPEPVLEARPRTPEAWLTRICWTPTRPSAGRWTPATCSAPSRTHSATP